MSDNPVRVFASKKFFGLLKLSGAAEAECNPVDRIQTARVTSSIELLALNSVGLQILDIKKSDKKAIKLHINIH